MAFYYLDPNPEGDPHESPPSPLSQPPILSWRLSPAVSDSGENDVPIPHQRKRKMTQNANSDNQQRFSYFPEEAAFHTKRGRDGYNYHDPKPFLYDREMRVCSGRAKWDLPTEEAFVQLCYEHLLHGQLQPNTFTETTWKQIQSQLLSQTNRYYDIGQLKSKIRRLGHDWMKFTEIMHDQTSIGWDPLTSTLTAPDDFWAVWLAAHPGDTSYKYKAFPHFDLCTNLFSRFVATGQFEALSTGNTFDSQEDEDGGAHPSRCAGKAPTHPKSSSDKNGGGALAKTTCTRFPNSTDAVADMSLEKFRPYSPKVEPTVEPLMDVISVKAEHETSKQSSSVAACVEVLDKMEGIPMHLYLRACDEFLVRERREMFMVWREDVRRGWIKSLGSK